MQHRLTDFLFAPVSNAPLVVFRVIFGAMMLFSTLRFWYLGWIEDHYLDSIVQFKYFGFEWVQLLPPLGMYALHVGMLLGALGMLLGAWYRFSAALFFLCFTYTELIDLTYYLNHYYFVSLVAFWLVVVPANKRFSIDAWRKPQLRRLQVPRWCILVFQVQLAIVYCYAGLAKINYDWLVNALPLRIWLPAGNSIPVLGPLLSAWWMPWAFAWAGMLYDCTIVFFLSWRKTRGLAYVSVLFFHIVTGILFQIGVFPLVMIGATLLFFDAIWHENLLRRLEKTTAPVQELSAVPPFQRRLVSWGLGAYLFIQLLFPWRYLLYPGNVFWTEEGYRFSWRVMLMEKAGTATFFVKDPATGREGVVNNSEFLCEQQEKQMAMQPDLILQFAHFLANHYSPKGGAKPEVRAEVYVTLNGHPSQLLIDPTVNLAEIEDGWRAKTWIKPFTKMQ